jgi:hypothetical protein
MNAKVVASLVVLLVLVHAPARAAGQASNRPGAEKVVADRALSGGGKPAMGAFSIALLQGTESQPAKPAAEEPSNPYQQPHLTVVNPPPIQAEWPLRDRISWGANLVLTILEYGGIIIAISILRKIERQTTAAELAAQAAAENASAALLHARSIINAERPWLLITVEPTLNLENSFTIVAANRGRSPARIVAIQEQIMIAIDETQLPRTPEYTKKEEASPAYQPSVLLPGESTGLRQFSRDDVKTICVTDERLKRVEDWEERIYLYGKVAYRDLLAPQDKQPHETDWCCWYIHGRQKSGMVIAGTPEYNTHS